MIRLFNPEHDLCLANDTPGYTPVSSALQFGQDCQDILHRIMDITYDKENKEEPILGKVSVWGWDSFAKKKLLQMGVPSHDLPSDHQLNLVRDLSHRRTALQATDFIRRNISDTRYLCPHESQEIDRLEDIDPFLEKYGQAVFKAPWSGSGKGLRWMNRNQMSHSDEGWCRNTIRKQGSLIAEAREEVVQDFAMLFAVHRNKVLYEGLSLFNTWNGTYRSNILASNQHILGILSRYVPMETLEEVRMLLLQFIEKNFLGRYRGFVGVDMFICRNDFIYRNDTLPYVLSPCVEINVRMTMGLLARRYYDRKSLEQPEIIDGRGLFLVLYEKDPAVLKEKLSSATDILTPVYPDTRYAIAIYHPS